MSDKKPEFKFTVIIPTRERWDTLEWALKTCTTQNYDNFEIIVSDNFSQDRTREIVEANKDPRIRYVNTGKRLSMTGNYEFALTHATGDYICLIGDDDGLMPNALSDLNALLSEYDVEAVSWKSPLYIWDNWHEAEHKNTIMVPFKRPTRKINSREALEELLTFRSARFVNYTDLAAIYRGFVSSRVINDIRSRNGRFFHSMIPDVYASIAVTAVTSHFLHSTIPFTVDGNSSHSIGRDSADKRSVQRFQEELETDAPSEPFFKLSLSPYICTAEAFLQAQKNVDEVNDYTFNANEFVFRAMEHAHTFSAETYRSVVEAVRQIGQMYNIQDNVEKAIAANPIGAGRPAISEGYNFLSGYLMLRFEKSQVKNVYDASLECEKIFKGNSGVFFLLEANRFLLNSFKNYGIAKFTNRVLHHLWRKDKPA